MQPISARSEVTDKTNFSSIKGQQTELLAIKVKDVRKNRLRPHFKHHISGKISSSDLILSTIPQAKYTYMNSYEWCSNWPVLDQFG